MVVRDDLAAAGLADVAVQEVVRVRGAHSLRRDGVDEEAARPGLGLGHSALLREQREVPRHPPVPLDPLVERLELGEAGHGQPGTDDSVDDLAELPVPLELVLGPRRLVEIAVAPVTEWVDALGDRVTVVDEQRARRA